MANQVARSGGDGGHYTMATCVMMVLVSMATCQKHFPPGRFLSGRFPFNRSSFYVGCAAENLGCNSPGLLYLRINSWRWRYKEEEEDHATDDN